MNTAIVILAAGKSSRMEQPKQMLIIEGKTLVKRTAEMAMKTDCYPICVVVGANKKLIVPELANMPTTLIDNPHYEQGMASSIKIGLIGVYMTEKNIDAVIFLTCDMPFINEKLIVKLIEKASQSVDSQGNTPLIVASKYENQLGIPALFKRAVFNDLLELSGDKGAKSVILKHKNQTAFVDFPDGKFDLDTPAQYLAVIQKLKLEN